MPDNWDVDGALKEVTDAIESATVYLGMDDATRGVVQEIYRKGFEARTEAEWRANRSVVLERAGLAGRCAELATIVSWVDGVGEVGKLLDKDTVAMVCVMVSRFFCHATVCDLCPDVDYTAPKGQELDAVLKQIEPNG